MVRLAAGVLVGLATILAAACAYAPLEPGSGAAAANLQFCLSEINRYRATLNRAALQQSSSLDDYAATAAEFDGSRHNAHAYANSTNFSGGYVRFENEIPWWSLRIYGSVRAVIRQGLATMWAQGPTGEHYQTMTHPATREFGCGVYLGNGEVTVVQAYR